MAQERPRRPPRRYRIRPKRLALVLIALGFVLWLGWSLALRSLALVLALPAPRPLAAAAPGRFTAQAGVPYAGRPLAVRVDRDGAAAAAVLEAAGLVWYQIWPDGRRVRTSPRIAGEPVAAGFDGQGNLLVWAVSGAASADRRGTLYCFSNPAPGASGRAGHQQAPSWSLPTSFAAAALQPLPEGSLLLGAAADGVPATCLLVDGDGRVVERYPLVDGTYTAWATVAPGGGFVLGGAAQGGAGLTPFIRIYDAGGELVSELIPTTGPPARLAAGPTGKHILAATPTRVTLWQSDGGQAWSRRLAGEQTTAAAVYSQGGVFLAAAGTSLVLGPDGRVSGRWRTAGLGRRDGPAPIDLTLLSLPGGAALIDPQGRVVATAAWTGVSELVASDPAAAWLVRAGDDELRLYRAGNSR